LIGAQIGIGHVWVFEIFYEHRTLRTFNRFDSGINYNTIMRLVDNFGFLIMMKAVGFCSALWQLVKNQQGWAGMDPYRHCPPSVGKYFWAASLLLTAENGQINELQRSVECAQINQSTVDTIIIPHPRIRQPQSVVPQSLMRSPQSQCHVQRAKDTSLQIHLYRYSLSFERARFLDFFDCLQTENNSKLFTDKSLRIFGIFLKCTEMRTLHKTNTIKALAIRIMRYKSICN